MARRLCLLMAFAVGAVCQGGEGQAWWNAAWKTRSIVRVELPEFALPAGLEKVRGPAPEHGRITVQVHIQREGATTRDNSDIRVVDGSGKVLPCRVYTLGAENQVTVLFPAPERSAEYYVYYDNSNPGAAPGSEWKPPINALNYVVGRHGDPNGNFELTSILKGLQAGFEELLRGTKPQIANMYEVPGGGGPERRMDMRTIACYEGYLLCPVAGRYVFSIDHRGAAYILIDGKLVVEARALYPTPRTWPQPDNIVLSAGYHHLFVVMFEETPSRTIRFGWQMPGMGDIDSVPLRFYAKYIDGTVTGMQQYGQPETVFFNFRVPPEAIILKSPRTMSNGMVTLTGNTDVALAYTVFTNLSNVSDAGEVAYQWEFQRVIPRANPTSGKIDWGDAPKPSHYETSEPAPALFLQVDQTYRVKLTASRGERPIGSYMRLFTVASHDASAAVAGARLRVFNSDNVVHNIIKPSIRLEVLSAPNIVYAGEKNNAAFRVVTNLNYPVPVDWAAWITRSGKPQTPQKGRFFGGTGKDEIMTFPLQLKDFPERAGTMTVSLSVLQTETNRVEFAVKASPGDFSDLSAPLGYFTNADGQRVVICTTMEDEAAYRKWMLPKYLQRKFDTKAKRVLLFGAPMVNAPLPGQPAAGYVDYVKDLVKDRTASYDFVRRTNSVSPALTDIVKLSEWLRTNDPEVLVISPGLDDAEQGASREDFSRGLDVMIDLLRAKGHYVKIVLVTPPPLVSNPKLSKLYRDEMHYIARKHHAVFVDIHELLVNRPNWQEAYRISPGAEVYNLYFDDATHKLIAEKIAGEL